MIYNVNQELWWFLCVLEHAFPQSSTNQEAMQLTLGN